MSNKVLDTIKFNLLTMTKRHKEIVTRGPVRALDIFGSSKDEFHSEGLFSTEIFGPVGSRERNLVESYIELNCEVINPVIFGYIAKMSNFYVNIMKKTKYAKWDTKTKTFVPSDEDGNNGMAFFISHLHELKFPRTGSKRRDRFIKRFEEARKRGSLLMHRNNVFPAGIRDYYIGKDGLAKEDESNTLYRSLLRAANNLASIELPPEDMYIVDPTVWTIQRIVNQIHKHFFNILDGKKKVIRGKWSSRQISVTTRNVFTSIPTIITDLEDESGPTLNHTTMGIFQLMKSIVPFVIHSMKVNVTDRSFNTANNTASLWNIKTGQLEHKELTSKEITRWTTYDGIEELINHSRSSSIMDSEILFGKDYTILLCGSKDDEIHIKTDGSPTDINYRPITYGELFYILLNLINIKAKTMVTRFPVTGDGSIYPSYTYLKSTMNGLKRHVHFNGSIITANEWPIRGEEYVNTMSPASNKLVGMGADYDGDKGSAQVPLSKEANEALDKYFDLATSYVGMEGTFIDSSSNAVAEGVFKLMKKREDKK